MTLWEITCSTYLFSYLVNKISTTTKPVVFKIARTESSRSPFSHLEMLILESLPYSDNCASGWHE